MSRRTDHTDTTSLENFLRPIVEQFGCDLDDGTLTLRAPNSTYRFAGQPQAEPASLSLTLNRIGD